MRDVIIIVIIILLVFGGGYLSGNFLEGNEKELVDFLNTFHGQIRNGDMSHIDEVYELMRKWEESKPKWHILANHQEIDDIEAELTRFVEAYELGSKDDASISLVEIIFRINDMHKGEKLDLVNIL